MPLTLVDLRLAWNRVLQDHREERVFVTNPVILGILTSAATPWLEQLADAIANDSYTPSAAVLVEVPKGRGAVRPGTSLLPEDQVVYTALVGKLLPHIMASLEFDPGPVDHAYQIEDPNVVPWLKNRFKCWDEFRRKSVEMLDAGVTTMISTDITGFYDHISLEILFSDLRRAGAPPELLPLLSKCLSRWAYVNGRGIPQGMSASDILAKLYLTTVDHSLREAGITHIRYVDDFRLFCDGRPAAKRTLLQLIRGLRRRGLSLQSAKTEILPSDKARNLVDGIIPTLKPLAKNYLAEIAKAAGLAPKYLTIAKAERWLEKKGVTPPTEMLREAYEVFIENEDPFNSTMLHYLLNRLGKAKDTYAVDHAVELLYDHPEETHDVIRYLTLSGSFPSQEETLVDLLTSDDAVYPYQHFQVIQARLALPDPPSAKLLGLVRDLVHSANTPQFLRSASLAFMGRFGSDADLEALSDAYATALSEYDRAEILAALDRLEKTRRNAILGHAKDDGFLPSQAVICVKQGKVSAFLKAGAA